MVGSAHQRQQSGRLDRILWFTAACLCICNLATSIAMGQQGRPRYLLTPLQVVGAMEDRQLPTRGVQVRLAVPITAAAANPSLEIQAIAQLNSHEMRLRMACRDRSECLSFFATATYPEELSVASVQAKPHEQTLGRISPVSATTNASEAPRAVATIKQADPARPPVLRSGSPATLEFDQDRVHIHIEVICLESGAAGDKVRVTTRDRKQVYVAQIVTPTLLKGNF